MSFLLGSKDKFKQLSTLEPGQEGLKNQLFNASGGAFGQAADYYKNLLSNNSEDFRSFAAPELRQFQEQTVPGLAEQFAGMGSGGLSSSGFRNAAVSAGSDLSERLGAIRARLREQGAQGLMGLGQQGLQRFNENVQIPGQEGFFSAIAPGVGAGLTALATGGLSGIGGLTSAIQGLGSQKGKSQPYGQENVSREQIQNYKPSPFELPKFGQR